eukprot:scaffold139139_cov133-Phaeocystis_antarctica.AAC.2
MHDSFHCPLLGQDPQGGDLLRGVVHILRFELTARTTRGPAHANCVLQTVERHYTLGGGPKDVPVVGNGHGTRGSDARRRCFLRPSWGQGSHHTYVRNTKADARQESRFLWSTSPKHFEWTVC